MRAISLMDAASVSMGYQLVAYYDDPDMFGSEFADFGIQQASGPRGSFSAPRSGSGGGGFGGGLLKLLGISVGVSHTTSTPTCSTSQTTSVSGTTTSSTTSTNCSSGGSTTTVSISAGKK
jgi:hypothetical protein